MQNNEAMPQLKKEDVALMRAWLAENVGDLPVLYDDKLPNRPHGTRSVKVKYMTSQQRSKFMAWLRKVFGIVAKPYEASGAGGMAVSFQYVRADAKATQPPTKPEQFGDNFTQIHCTLVLDEMGRIAAAFVKEPGAKFYTLIDKQGAFGGDETKEHYVLDEVNAISIVQGSY